MPFLIYRDNMRAEGLNHYPYISGMALNQYRINTWAASYLRGAPPRATPNYFFSEALVCTQYGINR